MKSFWWVSCSMTDICSIQWRHVGWEWRQRACAGGGRRVGGGGEGGAATHVADGITGVRECASNLQHATCFWSTHTHAAPRRAADCLLSDNAETATPRTCPPLSLVKFDHGIKTHLGSGATRTDPRGYRGDALTGREPHFIIKFKSAQTMTRVDYVVMQKLFRVASW